MREKLHHPEEGQQQHETEPEWKYISTTRNGLVSTCEFCVERPYLSLTLPNDEPGKHIILRRVIFTTASRDQGFASEHPELNGRYFDSQTYFEVSVTDRNGQDRVPREILIHNVRAEPSFTKHIVAWDYRDDSLYDAEKHYPPITTRGFVPCHWVNAIRAGDTIGIIPRAEHTAWKNFISGACIEFWVEVMETTPTLERRFTDQTHRVYRALQPESKEIRLVMIEPTAKSPDDIPQLTTLHTSLTATDRLRYEALSYCWGETTDVSPIRMSDHEGSEQIQIMISGNLQRALKRLKRYDTPRVFWIDLLCIDQGNLDERAQQVALMGQIYSAAESVSVWLGEIEENVHTAKDLGVLGRIARMHDPNLTGNPSERRSLQPSQTHDGFFENDHYNFNLYFPDRIFLRHWFQRVWVLQEVWNASSALCMDDGTRRHAVSVICGDIELPWWAVVQANLCLSGVNYQRRGNFMPILWADLFENAGPSHNTQIIGRPGPRLDILDILLQGLDMRAMDPRDRIFALLVFGRETHNIAELPASIRPSYAKSTAEVYASFTVWWIKEHKSLKILSAVHALRGRTWVDLSGDQQTSTAQDEGLREEDRPSWTLWSNGDSSYARFPLVLNEPIEYRACGDRVVDIELLTSECPPLLAIRRPAWEVPVFRGIQISSITSIDIFPLAENLDPSGLTAASGILYAYFKLFDPANRRWVLRNDHNRDVDTSLRNLQLHLFAHQWDLQNVSETYIPCHGRPLFKTRDGQTGLCPSGTQVGDVVVIFYGGHVPYLVRPKEVEGIFQFIGECYLDGFMQGEAFDERDDRMRYEEEVFRLI